VRCNLADDDELRAALRGIETVYHCAAMAGAPGSLEDYERANVRGSVRLAELAAEAGVQNLIYVSSISVYAMPRGSRFLDETHDYDARAAERGVYTQSKLNADRAMREYAARHAAPRIVILRPGTIYGPGAKLPIGRFQLPSPSRRRPVVAGGGGVPMPLTYIDNVVDAMVAAARSTVPTGSVYNIIDAPDWDHAAVARALRERSAGRIHPFLLPYPLVWSLMLAVDLVTLVRRRTMGTARYRLERTLADMRYRSEAARRDLQWTPRVGLSEGLGRVLDAAREAPYPH
jgi:nucleoside-diphosphate-sugar epimerase